MKTFIHTTCFILGIFLSSCSSESTSRFDAPMDRTAALKHLDLPLPSSAHSIYLFDYAGGMQDLERYIRLDVSPEELNSAVEAMIIANGKMHKRSLPYLKQSIASARLNPPRKEFQPIKWWNPSSVKTGYYRGQIDAYALRILVDTDNSRIYIYIND